MDKGLISLDDPAVIDKYCPEIVSQPILKAIAEDGTEHTTDNNQKINLRHLLTHTSGLAYPFISPLAGEWHAKHNIPSMFAANADLVSVTQPLLFAPGTGWCYSQGLDWAGILVERVTNQNLEEYFRQNIFEPCGITSMTFYPSDRVKSRLLPLSARDEAGRLIPYTPSPWFTRPWTPDLVTFLGGGAGLFGSARDYLRLLQNLLAVGVSSKPLISPESFKLLFENALPLRSHTNTCYSDLAEMAKRQTYHDPALLTEGTGEYIGHSVGLFINLRDSCYGRKAGSGCWDGAAKTQYWLDPSTGIAVSLISGLVHRNSFPYFLITRAASGLAVRFILLV
jgi:methyl acetate hydrolase